MKLLGSLAGRARLVIEYLLIGAVVSLGAWALWARGDMAVQNAKIVKLQGSEALHTQAIKSLVDVNAMQDGAIQRLRELRDLDAKQILGLQMDLTGADARGESMRAKVEQLEKNNARARDLLDLDIPDDIGCVLDDRPCPAAGSADQNGARGTERGAAPVVRGRAPGADPKGP